jgi:hypothetical protein
MNWNIIKAKIRKELLSSDLKTPGRRLNELDSIEDKLRKHLSDYFYDPIKSFNSIEKEDFKRLFAKVQNKKQLNGAESSLINQIYKNINS